MRKSRYPQSVYICTVRRPALESELGLCWRGSSKLELYAFHPELAQTLIINRKLHMNVGLKQVRCRVEGKAFSALLKPNFVSFVVIRRKQKRMCILYSRLHKEMQG